MVELPTELPNDPEQLKKLLGLIASERDDFFRRLQLLEHRYKEEMRAKYGRRSETIDPDQLRLFMQEALRESGQSSQSDTANLDKSAEVSGSQQLPETQKKQGHGRRKPQSLPKRPVIQDVPESEKTCPRCSYARDLCGRSVTLQLDYIPGYAFYWEYIRLKYACRACEGNLVTAPMPDQPIERGMPAPGMLAYIATSKYADHLPLYRLEGILSRQGLILSRSTMCDWMQATTKILLGLFEHMMARVKKSKVIWTDDTPIRVLDKELKKRTRTGRIWVYRGDENNPYVLFKFTPSRKRDGPREHLENFTGFMQADAFSGYDCIFVGGGVKEVACFAHARRKFVAALDSSRSAAAQVLQLIQELYQIESDCRERTTSERVECRQKYSVPILAQLKDLLDAQVIACLPQSPLAAAIKYSLNHWQALNVFTTDGDLTIDNNLAENAVRPIALGRKNWMFAGSEAGGQAIAVLSSITATCRRLSVDPFAYLKSVIMALTEDPDIDLDLLLPDVLQLEP